MNKQLQWVGFGSFGCLAFSLRVMIDEFEAGSEAELLSALSCPDYATGVPRGEKALGYVSKVNRDTFRGRLTQTLL